MSAREKLEHKKQLVLDKSWVYRKKGLKGLTGRLENNRTEPVLVAETFHPDITCTIAKCLFEKRKGFVSRHRKPYICSLIVYTLVM